MENQDYIQSSAQDFVNEQEQDMLLIKANIENAEEYQKYPEAFSRLFTEHTVIVHVAGIRITGRNEIYQFMKKAMKSFLADIIAKNEVEKIIFVR